MTLTEYIKAHVTDKETLPFKTTTHHYKKGEQIIKVGEFETGIYFIVSGIVEAVIDYKGKETIVDFYFSNQFPSSYLSYATKQPSDINLNCLTNCEIEKITIADLIEAQKNSRIGSQLSLHMLGTNFILRILKEKNLLTKTADERFIELINNRPEIIQLIPNSRVAKYLGIHPSSLSRIKQIVFK